MVIIQGVSMFIDGHHQIQLCMSTHKYVNILLYLCIVCYVNTNFLIVNY